MNSEEAEAHVESIVRVLRAPQGRILLAAMVGVVRWMPVAPARRAVLLRSVVPELAEYARQATREDNCPAKTVFYATLSALALPSDPMVLFFKKNELSGQGLLSLLQDGAEAWAALAQRGAATHRQMHSFYGWMVRLLSALAAEQRRQPAILAIIGWMRLKQNEYADALTGLTPFPAASPPATLHRPALLASHAQACALGVVRHG